MKRQILFPLLVLVLFACTKKYSSIPHGYYTLEYKNAAWGPQYSIWMINSDGEIWSSTSPSNWHQVDSLGYISEALLMENIQKCDTQKGKTSKRKMYKHNKLINGAANGTLSDQTNSGNDAGTWTYTCYKYDEAKGLYKQIILAVEGDFAYSNTSSEAQEITTWMKSLE